MTEATELCTWQCECKVVRIVNSIISPQSCYRIPMLCPQSDFMTRAVCKWSSG